jgi:uncharacterized Zn finger protein (UPF0148 family)
MGDNMTTNHTKHCTACGKTLKSDAAFCTNCGARLSAQSTQPTCPACGTTAEAGDMFCTNCGHRFTSGTPEPTSAIAALAEKITSLACDFLTVRQTAPGRFELSSQTGAQAPAQRVNIRYEALILLDEQTRQVTFWERMTETKAGVSAGVFAETRTQKGAQVSKTISGHLLSGGPYGFEYGKLREVVKSIATEAGLSFKTVVLKPKMSRGANAGKPSKKVLIAGLAVVAFIAVVAAVSMIGRCSSTDTPLFSREKAFEQEGVVADGKPFIETHKKVYASGEPIRVHYYNAPGSSRDWITVVPAGSPDRQVGPYQHLPHGRKRGIITFSALSAGRYEVRAYYNYDTVGYKVATRFAFNVERGEADR